MGPNSSIAAFISYPKSGRSWVRYALLQLGLADSFEFHHDSFEFNDRSKPNLELDWNKRLAKYETGTPIVFMSRDPRDIMVSLYYQIHGRFCDTFAPSADMSTFLRDPYFGATSLQTFREQWSRLLDLGRAIHVSYEECHADMEGMLSRICMFIGLKVPVEEMRRAVEQAEFSRMRAVEESNAFPHGWLRLRNGFAKTRLGMIGSHRHELSAYDISYLNEVFFSQSLSVDLALRKAKIIQ